SSPKSLGNSFIGKIASAPLPMPLWASPTPIPPNTVGLLNIAPLEYQLIPNFGTLGGFKLKLPLILMRGSFILGVGKVILNIFFIAFIPLLIALFAFSIPLLNLLTTLFKTLLTIFSTDLKSPLNIE